jgi:hypothetical protein
MEETNVEVIKGNLQIEQQIKSGASWFFWISSLSLINSFLLFSGANINFPVGLGVTELLTYVAKASGGGVSIILFILNCVIASLFVIFGRFAVKRKNWAFVGGMIMYLLDGLLLIYIQDYVSAGFHVFALYFIFNGYKLNKKFSSIKFINNDNNLPSGIGKNETKSISKQIFGTAALVLGGIIFLLLVPVIAYFRLTSETPLSRNIALFVVVIYYVLIYIFAKKYVFKERLA